MHTLVLAAAVSVLAAPAPAPSADCPSAHPVPTAQHAPMQARKLGDLPDAEMDLAVLRTVDGCSVRQVIRFNVSDPNPADRPAPTPGFTGTLVPEGPAPRTQPAGR